MSDSCPIIDETKLNIALENIKTAGIDLSELTENCPINGGRKRRLKKGGAIQLDRHRLKLILVFIAVTLTAFASVDDLIGGLRLIQEGKCTNMWSYFNMFPHPVCSFYKSTSKAVAGALINDSASILQLGKLVAAVTGAPLAIYAAVDPLVSIIAPILRVLPGIEYKEQLGQIENSVGGRKSKKSKKTIKSKKSKKSRKSNKNRKTRKTRKSRRSR
jgi:hypothetical protein